MDRLKKYILERENLRRESGFLGPKTSASKKSANIMKKVQISVYKP